MEVTSLSAKDLSRLVRKTRVLINTVGPYHLYSTPVVEACAANGTHYLDVTGEAPWVLEIIEKYDKLAKTNHAIIIPEIGIESAPSDLLAFALVQFIRRRFSVGTKEVVGCVHELKGRPSGGTLATALGLSEHYSVREIARASGTWATSPVPGPKHTRSSSWMTRLSGIRKVKGLGTLTTSITAGSNVPIVQRSWGLLDGGKIYGETFSYEEYAAVSTVVIGCLVHFAFALGVIALHIPPFQWLTAKFLYAPGQGAKREATKRDALEYRAVATAEQDIIKPNVAFGRLRWEGGNYQFTGVCLAEAAMVLLEDSDIVKKLDGGLLTPAMIAEPFMERLVKAGMIFEVDLLWE